MTITELKRQIKETGLESLGVYYGKYRGFVRSINDPEQIGRLRLEVPQVWGEGITHDYWAYPFGIYAGANEGFFFLPAVGEMVWVEFERGDPSFPIWTYGSWGKNEPPAGVKTDYGKNYTLATPGGYYLEINEAAGVETFTLAHKNGVKVVFNNTGFSIIRNGKKIALGALNGAAEPGVLGNKNELALKGINNQLTAVVGQIQGLIAALVTEAGAFGAAVVALAPAAGVFVGATAPILAQLTLINAALGVLDATTIPATKSTNITTD